MCFKSYWRGKYNIITYLPNIVLSVQSNKLFLTNFLVLAWRPNKYKNFDPVFVQIDELVLDLWIFQDSAKILMLLFDRCLFTIRNFLTKLTRPEFWTFLSNLIWNFVRFLSYFLSFFLSFFYVLFFHRELTKKSMYHKTIFQLCMPF